MEALFYHHTVAEATQRRGDLRQALHAFLADPTSRAAVQLIGLFVRIPTPSTITAAAAAALPPQQLTSSAAVQTAAVTPTASAAPRRQTNAQKLAWCAFEADRRLRQAAEDAADLNRWVQHGTAARETVAGVNSNSSSSARRRGSSGSGASSSSPSSSFSSLRPTVVVVAYLAPQAREDITVYESWQRCAEAYTTNSTATSSTSLTTRRLSPLRRASFVSLSLGAPALLLSWADSATRCHLGSLLLPHQSLLFDLTWCVSASLTANVAVREKGRATGAVQSRVTYQVLLDLFTQDVLPRLHFPKGESRSAFWLAYSALLSALHPRVFTSTEGDLGAVAHAPVDPSFHHDRAPVNVNAESFARTHRLLRQLFSGLFHSVGGGGVPGRTQALRVLLSYGGTLSPLKRQLVHVAVHHHRGMGDGGGGGGGPTSTSAVEAALLRTRSLVDVYALFGVLVGQDRCDFYAAAAAFVRTATRRCSTAAAAAVTSSSGASVESAQVCVQARATGDTPNVFVEVGARALARRRNKLERQRLGKMRPHLRPRERAARAQKHKVAVTKRQAAAQRKADAPTEATTKTTTTIAATAGEKRSTAAAGDVDGDDNTSGQERTESAAPAKRKRKTEVRTAVVVPAAAQLDAAKDSLSWSVDVG